MKVKWTYLKRVLVFLIAAIVPGGMIAFMLWTLVSRLRGRRGARLVVVPAQSAA